MAKKKIEVDACVCDVCGASAIYSYSCLNCGLDTCLDCSRKAMRSFQHGVWTAGSGDGVYCNACIEKLSNSGDKLFAAYMDIQFLRNENHAWYESFKIRAQEAEDLVEKLRGKNE